MSLAYKVPGVYREEEFQKPEVLLPTGIAGFVGVAKAKSDGNGNPLATRTQPTALYHPEDFDFYFEKQSDSFLANAVNGFFQNGGVCCYIAYAETKAIEQLEKAVEVLAPLTDVDLIAAPDAVNFMEPETLLQFQQWLLNHCAEQGNRLAILDIPIQDLQSAPDDYLEKLVAIMSTAKTYGAIYYPWLKVNEGRPIPPCGHVAGIFARSDAKAGFFKAPANEEIMGVFDLVPDVSFSNQEQFNPLGINCIRATPGRGIRLMGARTLSSEPEWRYINVRRLVITLQRSIDANMGWAVFEPNTLDLWVRIKRELDTYLHSLWLRGALQGNTAEQAYYVKCDDETNPPDILDNGGVRTEIGIAPIVPAEFVVVHIVHRQQLSTEAGGNV
ncbi:hypothetical protein W03_10470 [Nitrosomonas sp. PY1]|uniref:phage tail sheath family protein n=1 Tax=Nitrosomonas sp. PY1 TaxID=1803906 RepID=UPI001FC893A1|nr:phage tail sheath subtilisin-like domain-containing protein [Nitrosomonas sp. PY1]GKS69043.1 hypothetical protein W03_10470 [Nitrosomonas sp. PY1]